MATMVYTAIIEKERERGLYAALCPELDVASQGATVGTRSLPMLRFDPRYKDFGLEPPLNLFWIGTLEK